ncbi:MAG: acetylesterase [Verrucomicrobiales bacterium VVV1]|nr:MAG: acetylesterase [Verrucomicrobiales bacterium VVV1]
MKLPLIASTFVACLALTSLVHAAGGGGPLVMPDFTKGEGIPAKATHDWNLGPTGLRGWMFCDKMVTTDARQISITKVEAGSPSDGVFTVGDVILGVGGKPFSFDPRTELGRAITAAETDQGGGKLALTRWRAGKEEQVVVKLPVLGTYSATAPYGCTKSKRIFEQGIKALAIRVAAPDYAKTNNPITRSLNALALLASGESEYLSLVKKEAEWASNFTTNGYRTWYYGYVTILVAEYVMATGDKSLLPGLQRLALESAKGQSAVGSWGHNFATPDGRLGGYGMMNAPGLPLTISLVMARAAGVKDPEVEKAIELSAKLMRFYIGKGSVPYGDHEPWMETHEDNGKCGMASVLFQLLGEAKGSEFFARMSLSSHGPERDCGHTGNFFNLLWSLPAVAQNGPQATGAWMREFGAWNFDLARRWDGTFLHQGPPEPQPDSYSGWDSTGAYLLSYAMPLKKIFLTGKKPSIAPQLDAATSQSLILDGRGWSNKDRTSAYDSLPSDVLIERLTSWSPIVRERAAMAFSRRKGGMPVPALIKLLDSPELDARYGACEALKRAGGAAAPAVPELLKLIDHQDLWLRIKAAEALSFIGKPAMAALPSLLERLAKGPSPEDPRAMEQRYLCTAVFEKLLRNSVEGVDPVALRKAILAGLGNQDGHARSIVGNVYKKLSFEEIKPLLPAIREALVNQAPSGEMFAEGVRLAGLEVLAAHHIEEGMQDAADYIRNQNKWASEKRTPDILKILVTYGARAKAVVPHLQETAAQFDQGEKDFPKQLSLQKAAAVREAIARIEASDSNPDLIRIR